MLLVGILMVDDWGMATFAGSEKAQLSFLFRLLFAGVSMLHVFSSARLRPSSSDQSLTVEGECSGRHRSSSVEEDSMAMFVFSMLN